MNAFSLKSLFLARHAQHVVLIHFPIALFLIGVLFDVLARITRRETLRTVAFYNIVTAAIFAVPAVITGLLAWQWQLEGQRLEGALLLHLVLGLLSACAIIVTAWMHARAQRRPDRSPAYLVLLEVAATLVVAVTAHLGGIVSGVNGPA
jgi:uncharacterized membrane protein